MKKTENKSVCMSLDLGILNAVVTLSFTFGQICLKPEKKPLLSKKNSAATVKNKRETGNQQWQSFSQ